MKPNHMRLFIVVSFLCFPDSLFAESALRCPPIGYDVATLSEVRERHFDIADDSERQMFARHLLACLSTPDPQLRDRVAYEAYATWRRNKSLDAATWQFIESSLVAELASGTPDPHGVIKPFAALVLAEAVKADRSAPYLSGEGRKSLLDAATDYLVALRDYRGFDDRVGWRHGVAHAADLLAQLALSPSFGKMETDQILAAIAVQIAPSESPYYVFGESERLAMAVAVIAARDIYTADEWGEWLKKISGPTPYAKWADAYFSQPGLAKRHDTMSFLLALYAQTSIDKRPAVSRLAPMILYVMKPLS